MVWLLGERSNGKDRIRLEPILLILLLKMDLMGLTDSMDPIYDRLCLWGVMAFFSMNCQDGTLPMNLVF